MLTPQQLTAKYPAYYGDPSPCLFPVNGVHCGSESLPGLANVCEYHVFWTTKDGEKIPIREMETRHFQNSLNLLLRQATRDYWFNHTYYLGRAMVNEARHRGLWGDPEELRERLLGEELHVKDKQIKMGYAGAYYSPAPLVFRKKP